MRPRVSDVARRMLVGAGLVVAFLLIFWIGGIYQRYGLLFSLLLMFVVTIMLVRAYSMGYRYRCANCGTVFKVALPVDFLTFSGVGKNPDGTYHTWKSLTCPSCGQRTRAVAVRVENVEQSEVVDQGTLPARRTVQRRGGRKRR